MPGSGLQGTLAGGGSHGAGGRDGSSPAASSQKRRLVRRPGYLRSPAGPGPSFLSPAASTPFRDPRGMSREESRHSKSSVGQYGLDSNSQGRGPSVQLPAPHSPAAAAGATGKPPSLAQTSVTPVCFGTQLRAGTRMLDLPTQPCGPGNGGCRLEFISMAGSEARGPSRDVPGSRGGARGAREAAEAGGPAACTAPHGSRDTFVSSFSFIQLSLDLAREGGKAEDRPPSGEPQPPRQSPWETGAEAASSDQPHQGPQLPSPPPSLPASPRLADWALVSSGSSRPESGGTPSLEMETCSLSLDPSPAGCCSAQRGGSEDAHGWDALLCLWEAVLQDCLRSDRRQLEVTSLRSKLQKLQDRAVAEGDREKAEALRKKSEELEQEEGHLHWVLPSRRPALHSFLGHLAAQAQAALHRATQQAGGDDTHASAGGHLRPPEPAAQDSPPGSTARRDRLLRQKQRLQEEIEALQTRMSVLEARDQQLGRELEEQELALWWHSCGLTARVARLPPGQLQEVSRALQDTLAAASRIPSHWEPPESTRSLQERIRSLNLSLKEIATKVGASESLCGTLRRRVRDLETQLPALLEAKALAFAGDFWDDCAEQWERLRSRDILAQRDLATCLLVQFNRAAVAEARVKENTAKYMEVLEEALRRCPLLGRVWGADLEACRLLLQSLELQEAGPGLSAEDEGQVDQVGAATPTAAQAASAKMEEERKTPTWACHGRRAPGTPSPRCAAEQNEEPPPIFPAELREKCDAIGKKLLRLEDDLDAAVRGRDEDVIQSLKGELQMVKETLQAMILQLQPAKEVGGGEAAASRAAAGLGEAQT